MYEHLFFDLDHTLWDFERNSEEVLAELFWEHRLMRLGVRLYDFLSTYYEVTYALWHAYDEGQISPEVLRNSRFPTILTKLGANPEEISCEALAQAYGERTPRRPHLMPHAREVLQQLQEKYTLHIITNGFPEMQALKMESARIRHFFQYIFTSAETGHKKPRPEMFYFALEKVQARPEHCLMIGDNPDTDLRGAANAGIPAVFYNPKKQASADIPHTLEIQCLRELLLHL